MASGNVAGKGWRTRFHWFQKLPIQFSLFAPFAFLTKFLPHKEKFFTPNIYGGNENLEAIEFLQQLNDKIHARKDGSLSIAEESTAWPQVTSPVKDGGPP